MRFPKHIADRELAGNPAEIVRAAFTLYWAGTYLPQVEEGSADGVPGTTLDEMIDDVAFLLQAGVGSIRELSRTYFETEELHTTAQALRAPQALQLSQQVLGQHFDDLTPELSFWMKELIKLLNDMEHSKWTEHIRLNHPGWLSMMLPHALGTSIVAGLQDSFVPILRQECNFELYATFLWVARNRPIESVGDVQQVRCCDAAGPVDTLGFTFHETDPPPKVYLTEDLINVVADCTAFGANRKGTKTVHDKILSLLAERLGLNAEERADTFRRWEGNSVFWHELGHQHAHALVNSRFGDRGKHRSDAYFDKDVRELYADAFAIRKMEKNEEPNWRLYWVASHSQALELILHDQPNMIKGHTHWYAVVRALLSDDPSGYMDELIATLEARRARPKQPSRAEWLRERLEKAREESRMMLGKLLRTR